MRAASCAEAALSTAGASGLRADTAASRQPPTCMHCTAQRDVARFVSMACVQAWLTRGRVRLMWRVVHSYAYGPEAYHRARQRAMEDALWAW